ncbi:hypothetical protein IGI96_002997 [Enterococcus sp. DIV0421]|uniref:hypothetical protein n=1 Tax=Enterococcus sp. DIV0421 TaxID=2774688 RepID=UPI003F216E49
MKTLEDEYDEFKQAMLAESIDLNHNYIRVEKACSPVLNMLGGGNGIYQLFFTDICWLVFLKQELLIVKEKTNKKEDHFEFLLSRISYQEVITFSIEKVPFWGEYCLKLKYGRKKRYFYIDGDDVFSFGKADISSVNFRLLLENHFNGLLKN